MKETFSKFTDKPAQQVLEMLKSSKTGLSNIEAFRRLKLYGKNQIESREIKAWQILLRQFRSPFVFLLIAASLLAFLLQEGLNGVIILIFITVNSVLGFYQEYKSEQTLKLLKQYTQQNATVIRNGAECKISAHELVPGDIVIIQAGDIVPADLRLIEHAVTADESILTGESSPAEKTPSPLKKSTGQIHQAENICFTGTNIVSGKAIGTVIATGESTAFGSISKLTAETTHLSTFEKGISGFSRFILRLVMITLVFVFILNLAIKGQSANLTELILFSIALGVSVVPEALPVVTTFSLSRGALRLAKKKVVVKRLSAIDDLGSIQVLCTDKTGTLTENKLTVSKVFADKPQEAVWLANLAASFLNEHKPNPNNAFDIALWQKLSDSEQDKAKKYQRIFEIPFDPFRRRNSVLISNGGVNTMIVRGAPEFILAGCKLSQTERINLENFMNQEADLGHRLIAIAKKNLKREVEYKDVDEKSGLEFIGIITFDDPLKKSAEHAILHAKKLGVQIKILTGDSTRVAGAVAYKIGLIHSPLNVITGDELENLSAEHQREAVHQYNVFARVSPEQKYLIIKLLEEDHEVGFLGEGINDAPALKIANVALVVHGAADIAKEAADIVLLQSSLEVIINGIREGREVFANTIKYIKATLASNFGNFYAIAVASLFVNFLPMLPIQILLVNLLSDLPMISIATDNVDMEELKRPREYNIKDILLISTILGILSTIFDFIIFSAFYQFEPAILQTGWFIGSIMTELAFLFSIRTKFFFLFGRRPSWPVLALTGLAAVITITLPFTDVGHRVFAFKSLEISHMLILASIVGGYFIFSEIVKLAYYRTFNGNKKKSAEA